jgi:hypothetical protein
MLSTPPPILYDLSLASYAFIPFFVDRPEAIGALRVIAEATAVRASLGTAMTWTPTPAI